MGRYRVTVEGVDKLLRRMRTLPENVRKEAQWELREAANEMVKIASENAPAHEGSLRNAIQAREIPKGWEVTMSKTHGVFMEFGTKSKRRGAAPFRMDSGQWSSGCANTNSTIRGYAMTTTLNGPLT
jgi:predicted transcriptional regulator